METLPNISGFYPKENSKERNISNQQWRNDPGKFIHKISRHQFAWWYFNVYKATENSVNLTSNIVCFNMDGILRKVFLKSRKFLFFFFSNRFLASTLNFEDEKVCRWKIMIISKKIKLVMKWVENSKLFSINVYQIFANISGKKSQKHRFWISHFTRKKTKINKKFSFSFTIWAARICFYPRILCKMYNKLIKI